MKEGPHDASRSLLNEYKIELVWLKGRPVQSSNAEIPRALRVRSPAYPTQMAGHYIGIQALGLRHAVEC